MQRTDPNVSTRTLIGQLNSDISEYTRGCAALALGQAREKRAVDDLVKALSDESAWVRGWAAFALGEVGAPAARTVPDLAKLLDHELHQVARASLDAMACIGKNIRVALPAIRRLLTVDNPAWQEGMRAGQRYGEVGVRFNALCALLNSDIDMDEVDDLMVACLGNVNGYVQALAVEALTRPRGSEDRPGLRHALDYLKAHRWDHTLTGERLL